MSAHVKQPSTITPDTRVPLYVVGSAIVLAALLTAQWYDLRACVDQAVTKDQVQVWIDDAREQNPAIHWPRLPAKPGSASAQAERNREN